MKQLRPYGLILTVFVVNAAIMTVELVASRLVARFLGQSLYTWTTIIGVVLAGMALGSILGGKLADRYRAPTLLAVVFFLASLSCIALETMNNALGNWTLLRGLPWLPRILSHIGITFIIPSLLLGLISPIVARFTLDLSGARGWTLGAVYAAAAAGSIGGTFAASICQRQASPRTISDEADLSLNNTPRYVPFWKTVHSYRLDLASLDF